MLDPPARQLLNLDDRTGGTPSHELHAPLPGSSRAPLPGFRWNSNPRAPLPASGTAACALLPLSSRRPLVVSRGRESPQWRLWLSRPRARAPHQGRLRRRRHGSGARPRGRPRLRADLAAIGGRGAKADLWPLHLAFLLRLRLGRLCNTYNALQLLCNALQCFAILCNALHTPRSKSTLLTALESGSVPEGVARNPGITIE